MTDNIVIKPLSSKKAASLKVEEGDSISLFRKPKLWEIDQTATGDSWCD